MNQSTGKIDLPKFREVSREQRERAKAGPEGHTIQQRASNPTHGGSAKGGEGWGIHYYIPSCHNLDSPPCRPA